MSMVGMAYDLVGSDSAEALGKIYRVDRMLLHPDLWSQYPARVPLAWTRVKFDSASVASVSAKEMGVYSFVAEPGIADHPSRGYLLYVGKVRDRPFRPRFGDYLNELSAKKPRENIRRMIKAWGAYLWFYYAPVSDVSIIDAVEDDLIGSFVPPFNRSYPAKIRPLMKKIFS
jgi:hypothetical protein